MDEQLKSLCHFTNSMREEHYSEFIPLIPVQQDSFRSRYARLEDAPAVVYSGQYDVLVSVVVDGDVLGGDVAQIAVPKV